MNVKSMAPILHKGDLIVANYMDTNFNDSKLEILLYLKQLILQNTTR